MVHDENIGPSLGAVGTSEPDHGKSNDEAEETERKLSAIVLAAAALIPAASPAQGVAERAGEVLDNAGRTIRRGVEGAVARGQATVREQDVFTRVYSRIRWDKAEFVGSVLELEIRADGMAVLRGSVPDAAARRRAVVSATRWASPGSSMS